MSRLLRCDQCHVTIPDNFLVREWVRVTLLQSGQDETIDYCPDCSQDLRAWLARPRPIAQGLTHPAVGGGPTVAEAEAALRPLRELWGREGI